MIPLLPFLHLLGGLGAARLLESGRLWGRVAVPVLFVWLSIGAFGIHPDQLSYFNETACLLRDGLPDRA